MPGTTPGPNHLPFPKDRIDDDVRSFAAERLAGFKVPRYVWMQDDPLPRTASSKVLKTALRERYARG